MILADKIMEERKRNGWSQEELAQKLGVSRQSVSKWESAQSVPDLNRILQLADLFSVSTDYLLKDEIESKKDEDGLSESVDISKKLRKVSMEEASEFLRENEKKAPLMAFGVSLCIISPVLLIILAGFSESGLFGISENAAAGLGIVTLLLLVSASVFIFIKCSQNDEKYKYLQTQEIETEYGVKGMVKEKKSDFSGKYHTFIACGVVLCILSCVPLIISSFVSDKGYVYTAMVGVLLVIVSVAVNMFVRVCIINGSYDILLQEGDYTTVKKEDNSVIKKVDTIYWCLATAIYLGWSFITGRWGETWIVWPVAGVSYAVVISIVKLVIKSEDF